jgi:hypothetical protein
MWHGGRVGTQADDHLHVEALAEVQYRLGERLPLMVGLRSVQAQDVPVGCRLQQEALDGRPLHSPAHPFHEVQGGSPGPVVQQSVRVEPGDPPPRIAAHELLAGIPGSAGGIDPTVEGQ